MQSCALTAHHPLESGPRAEPFPCLSYVAMKKSSLRQHQDRLANQGRRIAMIPYDDPAKAMRFQTNWPGLACMLVFVILVIAHFTTGMAPEHLLPALALTLLCGILSVFVRARMSYSRWIRVRGKCLDRELHLGYSGLGYGWSWRWLCEYELDGVTYQVTPAYWRSWGRGGERSKRQAERFANRVVDESGSIELWVNPANPLQTEVVGRDIKDLLLHRKSPK